MKRYSIFLLSASVLISCGETESDSFSDSVRSSSEEVLYVASGACYAGAVPTAAGANTITSFDLVTGERLQVIVDYNQSMPGDSPVSVEEFDQDHLIVLVENASGRRIDLVKKDGSAVIPYIINSTALNAIGRKLALALDGSGILVSKSTAIEKFSLSKARITQGPNPYINAPAAPCATATTLISDFTLLPNGKHVYIHAAATPNNKIGIVSAAGYASAADCLGTQAAPATTALPTAVLYHSTGKLLVAYGSVTAASNFIYSYDINPATNAISNPILAFSNIGIINGPTAIEEVPGSGDVLIAVGNSSFNTIERFSFNATSGTLSRLQSSPFITASLHTRCVSGLKVGTR